jgi:hypothetical protein
VAKDLTICRKKVKRLPRNPVIIFLRLRKIKMLARSAQVGIAFARQL